VPNAALTTQFANTTHEIRDDLNAIPAATKLFDVYATLNATACDQCGAHNAEPCDDVLAVPGCSVTNIATITTTDAFVSSPWADSGIFFQHHRTKAAAKARRTCTYATSLDDTGKDSTVLPTQLGHVADCEAVAKCPFASTKSVYGCPRDSWTGTNGTVLLGLPAEVQDNAGSSSSAVRASGRGALLALLGAAGLAHLAASV
jgi:hypothetical protein